MVWSIDNGTTLAALFVNAFVPKPSESLSLGASMRAPLVLAYAIGEEPVGAVVFVAVVDPVEGAAGAAVVAATTQL
jgi:hypothetical protein